MGKMKQKLRYLILVVSILLVTIIFKPSFTYAIGVFEKQINLIQEVFEIVSYYHVSEVNVDDLTKGAINGMLETLEDPYTTYFTEEEYQSFVSSIDGTFTGIGIYVEEKDGNIVVQSPIPGSPAEEAGLATGDVIVAVDGIDVTAKTIEEVASLIKGQEGTYVSITFKRDGKTLTKDIIRKAIKLPSVESSMLTDDIGYIRLYTFGSQTASEFNQHMLELENKGMEKLIFDLRGNPGGYLNTALEISKNFINEGPIIHIKNRYGEEQTLSISNGTNWDKPLVVLIDGGSASASELLAGALNDYDKATIIGQNSFGKGTVQSTVSLENGGYLKITTDEYFTANNNKVNGIGIKPEIEVEDSEKQLQTAINFLSNNSSIYYPTYGEDWIKASGKEFVAIKPLVDFFGGKVSYNSKEKAITIYLKGNTTKLPLAQTKGLKVIDGKSFLEIGYIDDYLKSITVNKVNDTLTIFSR